MGLPEDNTSALLTIRYVNIARNVSELPLRRNTFGLSKEPPMLIYVKNSKNLQETEKIIDIEKWPCSYQISLMPGNNEPGNSAFEIVLCCFCLFFLSFGLRILFNTLLVFPDDGTEFLIMKIFTVIVIIQWALWIFFRHKSFYSFYFGLGLFLHINTLSHTLNLALPL